MNENDIIAEFVKERYPELLETYEFAAFSLSMRWHDCSKVLKKDAENMAHFLQKVFDIKKR